MPALFILAVRRMPHSGDPVALYREQELDMEVIKTAIRKALQAEAAGQAPAWIVRQMGPV